MPFVGLLALLAFGAALTYPGFKPANGTRGLKWITAWLVTVLVLNVGTLAIYVMVDQFLLNHLGFIELPILIGIDLGMLVLCYVFLVVVIWKVAPSLRGSKTGFLASGRLLLPLLIIGAVFARYHVLSYCTSGWPADPRCEAVMGYSS